MATYNVAPYLDACLASMERALHGFRWVLVVGDDESTDGTWEKLCERFGVVGNGEAVMTAKGLGAERVLLQRFPKAPNVSIAKNRVIEMAAGLRSDFPAVCFMDADDEMGEGRVRHLLPFAVAGGHEFVRGDWIEVQDGATKEVKDRIGGPWMGLLHASLIPPNHRMFMGQLEAREDLVCWRQLEHRGFDLTYAPGPTVHQYNRRNDSVSRWADPAFRKRIHEEADRLISTIRRRKRVGLVGWNTAQGLGYLHRDLVSHLNIDHWLAPPHPRLKNLEPCGSARYWAMDGSEGEADYRAELARWDWLLICERPQGYPRLVELAVEQSVKIACVPMWEYLNAGHAWLKHVDLFLCPTRHCYQLLQRWRRHWGLKAKLVHVPWPIDVHRFEFRLRTMCERFVFFNGMGGRQGKAANGKLLGPRKGLDLVVQAARLVPNLPITIQVHPDLQNLQRDWPANVEVVTGGTDNDTLYGQGDVAIQPSRFEGLGLQSLECQAAGLPVITSACAPMDEHAPMDTIDGRRVPMHLDGRFIEVFEPSAEDLARAMTWWHRREIRAESEGARRFVEREHSWARRGLEIARWLEID